MTATPNQNVKKYLEKLSVDIGWITPEAEIDDEIGKTLETPALAPVHLEVYSVDELKDGLLTLAFDKKQEIAKWLNDGEDGAIISSALWRINQIYYDLKSIISTETMGRLTGAESRRGREDAKAKRLILATPTVDIGYNFDRLGKTRQNIDFLLLDARSGDEFIQRLGRAGRVLGKQQQDIPSRALAVVDATFYKALQSYDAQVMSRLVLRELAEEHLPARNSQYSYIKTGAIVEAFLPIFRLEGMASFDGKPDIEILFNGVQQLFASNTTLTYQRLKRSTRSFIQRAQDYGNLDEIPPEMTDCLSKCKQRLMNEQDYRKSHSTKLWSGSHDAYKWLQKDLRSYFIEKARFSFRDDFQPPLALVSDSQGLLSSESVIQFDALHIVKNYLVEYFDSAMKWQEMTGQLLPDGAKDAVIFCDLIELRSPEDRLKIGLKLSVSDFKRSAWEEEEGFAYKPTALYGLEITTLNNDHGLPTNVRKMFAQRYIPAFVVAKESRSASTMWSLKKQAQFIPYDLQIIFSDGKTHDYYVVLGTMALQIWCEIPYKDIVRDVRDVQSLDDDPLIF